MVSGNHDIARKTEEAAWKAMREKLAHAGLAASDWMAGGKAPVWPSAAATCSTAVHEAGKFLASQSTTDA